MAESPFKVPSENVNGSSRDREFQGPPRGLRMLPALGADPTSNAFEIFPALADAFL
jgi:hypothetical protein